VAVVIPEVILAAVASEPVSSVASESRRVAYDHTSAAVAPPEDVRVRVPLAHTSAAKEPNVVKLRVPLAQTFVGIVAAKDEEAVSTVASVLLLIVEIADVICELVFALTTAAIDVEAVVWAEVWPLVGIVTAGGEAQRHLPFFRTSYGKSVCLLVFFVEDTSVK
jgi:hypothetical protein